MTSAEGCKLLVLNFKEAARIVGLHQEVLRARLSKAPQVDVEGWSAEQVATEFVGFRRRAP